MLRSGPGAAVRVRWARAAGFPAQRLLPALAAAGGGADALATLLDLPAPDLVRLGLPAGLRARLDASQRHVEPDLAWLDGPDRHLVLWGDADYPPLLAAVPDAPVALWVRGDPAALRAPQVAVVGSRACTPTGREVAGDMAEAFATAGLVVTSGLAEGIDAAAHRGALAGAARLRAAGRPLGAATVAVCGTGPDRVYPARHAALAEEVAAQGAVITEFPPGTPARAEHFPQRNRLLCGLAAGTVVVEAAERSGSLITARLAAAQGREVFAVPGSVRNPQARGCHALLRDGAQLAEGAADVLKVLGFSPLLQDSMAPLAGGETPAPPGPRLDRASEILLDALGFDAVDVDTLVARTGLEPSAVSSRLLLLELRGQVEPRAGGTYVRLVTGDPAAAPRTAH